MKHTINPNLQPRLDEIIATSTIEEAMLVQEVQKIKAQCLIVEIAKN